MSSLSLPSQLPELKDVDLAEEEMKKMGSLDIALLLRLRWPIRSSSVDLYVENWMTLL
jgi:hypothetical protein